MKALFYNFSKKSFYVKKLPLPQVGNGEVLLKVAVSSLCATDLHIMEGPLKNKAYNKKEIVMGHSFAGTVESIGAGTMKFKKGDRVFASDFVWCGKCQSCLDNKQNFCDNRYVFGMEVPGSNAEFVTIPERAFFPLPPGVDFEQGSLICDVLALVYHAFKKANLAKNDQILVLGAGPVGLCLGLLLKSYSFNNFTITEKKTARRKIGKAILKKEIISPREFKKNTNQFEAVFDTSGSKEALDLGFKVLKRGGKLVMIGVQSEPFVLNSLKWISRELTLLGIFDFNLKDVKESLKLVIDKKIDLKKIITHRFSLDQGARAYRLLKSRKSGKIILLP